jgi:hypothetical protein
MAEQLSTQVMSSKMATNCSSTTSASEANSTSQDSSSIARLGAFLTYAMVYRYHYFLRWLLRNPQVRQLCEPSEIAKRILYVNPFLSETDTPATSLVRFVASLNDPKLLEYLLYVRKWNTDMNNTRSIFAREAMMGAASGGHWELLKRLLNHFKIIYFPELVDAAATFGKLEIIESLHSDQHFKFQKPVVVGSCFRGTLEALDLAASCGHLNVVEYLMERHFIDGPVCTTKTMDAVAENGHWKILKYLHENPRTQHVRCTRKAMEMAIKRRYCSTVKYLHGSGLWKGDEGVMMALAASVGCLELVVFFWEALLDDGAGEFEWIGWDDKLQTETLRKAVAVKDGDVDVIRYLIERRIAKPTAEVLITAIEVGNFDVVWYLVDKVQWDPDVMCAALRVFEECWPHFEQYEYLAAMVEFMASLRDDSVLQL